MPLPSDPGPAARAMAKQFKVLLPPSFHKLRITDELAGCFDTGEGEGAPEPTALVVSPFGKVWRVEVGRDGDGAFLGRGWAEFLAAHGVELGWFVVLRHEGGGALTVKVFDTSLCIKEFGAAAAVMTSRSSKGVICKPQFIRIFHPYLSEKMILPARFVKDYIRDECLNSQTAMILSPIGKFWHIELKNDQSGIFFTGGWSQFLEFHGICNGDVLLFRYDGNMVFKFKAFGLSGRQKDFRNQNAEIQPNAEKRQETHSPIRKRKSNDEKSSSEENKRPKSSVTSPTLKRREPYQIGTTSWIRKKINTYALERLLSLSKKFCDWIGFQMNCTITLKTKMDSTRSWQVRGAACKNYRYILGEGWKRFCQENSLKTGDLCTFTIIETTLWHVTIMRSTLTDTFKQKKSPCSSSRDHKTNKGSSSSEGTEKPKSSMTSLSKVPSYTRCVYDIGPPSWIRKEMNTNSITKHFTLSKKFCNSIGFRITCTITLKTEIDSTRSWQVRGAAYKDSCYIIGEGWKSFCQDNRLKTGDLCTFNIIKTTLWHVTITHSTLADTFKEKESPCSSSRDHKTNKGSSSSEGTKKPKSSMTSLSKQVSKSVYDIGPPSWIRKEMNTYSITQHLSLARDFCDQIGLRQHCTITLKTSINSNNSWQVGGLWQKVGSYVIERGWKRFCRENKVKVGDVCTFNVIETKLWHVVITRCR